MLLPPTLQTLYADLVQQLLDRTERGGTIYTQKKNGNAFLYVRRTAGAARVDEFLGPAGNASVAERASRIREEQVLSRQRRKIVSALRLAGMPAPTAALARVLDALSFAGLFQSGVLAGTAAYQCYPPIVGVTLPAQSLMTQDADFATAQLSLAARDGKSSMLKILQLADPTFRAVPALRKTSPPSSFRAANGFRVDLLTATLRRSDMNPMPLEKLSAGAVPLQYLNWLIRGAIPAAVLAGPAILVRVPQPARFAVHKLILAQKRAAHDRVKRQKDLIQARALMQALNESDPDAIPDALRSARRQGRLGWSVLIDRSLTEIKDLRDVY